MPLIRRMKFEALHCPQNHSWAPQKDDEGTIETGNREAEAYVSSLATLCQQTTALRSLHLTITPPSSLPTKEILTSLLPLQNSLSSILANLPFSSRILLSFEFSDCYYRIHLTPDFLAEDILLLVACKVLFWKGHLQIERMLQELEDAGERLRKEGERTDLGPLVEKDMGYMVKRVGELDEMLDDMDHA
ncbi:hypothetical protein N0V90_005717 [Kalmusia sp. IMI 367209]|nr:hypothetical protein N0V90_005717 [Kalmusia sp. IMI 367209]